MNPENCPVGLEYLLHVDRLSIKQQTEIMEVFTGIETANKYQVKINLSEIGPSSINLSILPPNGFHKVLNAKGEQVFFAAEMRGGVCGACTRQLCGSLRNFEMTLTG